jgi:hypothetical protein
MTVRARPIAPGSAPHARKRSHSASLATRSPSNSSSSHRENFAVSVTPKIVDTTMMARSTVLPGRSAPASTAASKACCPRVSSSSVAPSTRPAWSDGTTVERSTTTRRLRSIS